MDALSNMLLNSGVGAFRPNTVFIDIDGKSNDDVRAIVLDVMEAKFGWFLVSKPQDLNLNGSSVDVYWLCDDGGLTLLAGYIISKYLKKRLRVINVAYTSNGDTVQAAELRMSKLCEKFRIKAEIISMELSEKKQSPSPIIQSFWKQLTHKNANEGFVKFLLFSDIVRELSSNAAIVVSTLFVPTDDMDGDTYDAILKTIANAPPAFAFVRGNGSSVLSWKA